MSDYIHYTPDYKAQKEDDKVVEKVAKPTESFVKAKPQKSINYKQEYVDYLTEKGYSIGTTFSYSSCIERVMIFENIGDWQGIVNNINLLLKEYGLGGDKEDLGDLSHKAVINALRRFNEFLNEKDYKYKGTIVPKLDTEPEPNPEPKSEPFIPDDKLNKLLKILNYENITLTQCFEKYIDMVIKKGTTDIHKLVYGYCGYKFRGGPLLTIMGASWFVSYKYYNTIDRSHLNWNRVNITHRTEVYDITGKYHEEWLKKVLYMNSDNLSTAKIGLSGVRIKEMANIILKKVYNN